MIKSIVFSFAYDFGTFIFNWICFITDFIGLFAMIAWIFSSETNNDKPGEIIKYIKNMNIVSEIWIVMVIFCVAIPVLWVAIGFGFTYGFSMWDDINRYSKNCLQKYITIPLVFIIVSLMVILSSAVFS